MLLVTAAKLLQANLDRPQRVTVPGVPGGVAVYGRHQKPCFRCGTPVEVAKHGEHARVTYWCPGCQLLLGLAESDEPGDPQDDELFAGRRAARPVEDGWYDEDDDWLGDTDLASDERRARAEDERPGHDWDEPPEPPSVPPRRRGSTARPPACSTTTVMHSSASAPTTIATTSARSRRGTVRASSIL